MFLCTCSILRKDTDELFLLVQYRRTAILQYSTAASKSEFAKFVQQLNMQQSGQTDATYNIQQYWSSLWPTMLRQFARGFRGYEEDITDSETNFISQHLNDDKIVQWFLQARIALRLEKVDPNVEVSIHAHPCHPLQHRDEFQCLLTQS